MKRLFKRAVSTRHDSVCSVEHIADRASAYNIRGEVVDGQDVDVDEPAQAHLAAGDPGAARDHHVGFGVAVARAAAA